MPTLIIVAEVAFAVHDSSPRYCQLALDPLVSFRFQTDALRQGRWETR